MNARRSKMLTAVLLCLAVGCSACDWFCDLFCEYEPADLPKVTRLEVIPTEVEAVVGSSFRLTARLILSNGQARVVRSGLPWVSSDKDAIDHPVDGLMDVHGLPATGSPVRITATLATSYGTFSDFSDVTVHNAPSAYSSTSSSTTTDYPFQYQHESGSTPSVAVLDLRSPSSTGSGVCDEDDRVQAFADLTIIHAVQDPCNRMAVFSTGRESVWGVDFIPSTGTQLPVQMADDDPRALDVTVYVAATGEAEADLYPDDATKDMVRQLANERAMNRATMDVLLANLYFNSNRVGVWFEVDDYKSVPDRDVGSCENLPDPNDPNPIIQPGRINVYYVDKIELTGFGASARGLTCNLGSESDPVCYDDEHGVVIYVSSQEQSSSTLAHELGHALGLLDHAHEVPDLQYPNINVMSVTQTDEPGSGDRSHFTLGQVFWMNHHQASWLAPDFNPDHVPGSWVWDCESQLDLCPRKHLDVR